MTDRSVTMAATPTAMQRKKNSRRLHAARVSRPAMRSTNIIAGLATRAASTAVVPTPSSSRASRDLVIDGFHHPSVAQHQSGIGERRQLGVVCHQDDRGAAPFVNRPQELHDVPAVGRVEVAGRLVGQDDRRIVGERARERDPLLLPAGQLGRVVMGAPGEADLFEQSLRARCRASRRPMISIGTDTFSTAVSDGIRWKNWKTKPIFSPRSFASRSSSSRVMSTPSISTDP